MPVGGPSPTPACQSRGMPSGPPQAWVKSARRSAGNRSTGRARAGRAKTRGSRSNAGRIREPKWYGAPRPPNDEPVVGGALAVDDQVPVVGEGLRRRPSPAASQNDARQRLGGDDQRVHRRDRRAGPASSALQASVARTTRRRVHDAAVGDHPAGAEARRRGPLDDPRRRARSTARASPRTSRAGWIRAQCGVYVAAEHPGRPDQRCRRRRHRAAATRRPRDAGGLGAGPVELRRRAGQRDRAALDVVAVDVLRRRRPRRPRRRCAHRRAASPARRRPVPPGQRRRRAPGTAPSTSRRCARTRRTRRSPAPAPASAAPDRPAAGSTRSTGR